MRRLLRLRQVGDVNVLNVLQLVVSSRECYTYHPERGSWSRGPTLPSGEQEYAAAAGEAGSLYVAGGRRLITSVRSLVGNSTFRWDHDAQKWAFSNETWRYDSAPGRAGGGWTRLPDLKTPMGIRRTSLRILE